MALKVVQINGPAGSGKTTLARWIAGEFAWCRPCYCRFVEQSGDDPGGLLLMLPEMAVSRRCPYNPERVFDEVPGHLREVTKGKRRTWVLAETNTDPCFRMAHPFDLRIFVMAGPAGVRSVFRTSADAEKALRQALSDSGSFASEMFGMQAMPGLDDSRIGLTGGSLPARKPLTREELEQALSTAIGAEIAAQVRLQPEYHALLEADIVLLNAGKGASGEVVDSCARRLESLIGLLPESDEGGGGRRRPAFYCCDPTDGDDPLTVRLRDTIVQRVKKLGIRPS